MDTLISCAYVLKDEIGPGYDKSLYLRAFEVLLRERRVQYDSNKFFPIMIRGNMIGTIDVDIFVDDDDCAIVIETGDNVSVNLNALQKHVSHVLLIHFQPDSEIVIRQIK
jgi:GxxExxY protein